MFGLAAAAIAVGLVACGSDDADSSGVARSGEVDEADLDAVFPELDDEEPGCGAAVGLDGEVVWTGSTGAASLETLDAIDDETVFDIGSVSKQFTATAILLLADREELALDNVLSTHVTGLPAWAGEVTLKQLLHHQGGIPDYIELLQDEGYEYEEVTTVDDAMHAIANVNALDFMPGSRFVYSNTGYFLLSQVVESVTGTTLGDYLGTEVFEPLELDAHDGRHVAGGESGDLLHGRRRRRIRLRCRRLALGTDWRRRGPDDAFRVGALGTRAVGVEAGRRPGGGPSRTQLTTVMATRRVQASS